MPKTIFLLLLVTIFTLVGFFSHDSYATNSTTVTVTPNPATLSGGSVIFIVKVNDTSSIPTTPTGNVTWNSGNAGGTFNPSYCTLSSGICLTSYIPNANFHGTFQITALYPGDSAHSASSGTSLLSIPVHATTTTVTPSPSTVNSGTAITFTATVADISSIPTTPTGNVTWNSGNAGGTFNPSYCTLSSGKCMISYTPAMNSPSVVTITATHGGDSNHLGSAGISSLSVYLLHGTTQTIKPNPATLSSNGTILFIIKINDTSNTPITPSGIVSWSDNNAGGTFNATSCALSLGICRTMYTASANPLHVITINSTYSGDNTHLGSLTSLKISTNIIHTTTLSITRNPSMSYSENAIAFTATVTDTSNPSTTLIGIVSWKDNGAGGSFSPDVCILSSNHCSLSYTPQSNTTITIAANYMGDSSHLGSFGTLSFSGTNINHTSVVPTPTPSSFVYVIPNWIRNNAKWWHDDAIGDTDFVKGIQYMIQQKIMKIPETKSGNGTTSQIPAWVKNNAGWWAGRQISDDEFVKGIQYLIQVGIIPV